MFTTYKWYKDDEKREGIHTHGGEEGTRKGRRRKGLVLILTWRSFINALPTSDPNTNMPPAPQPINQSINARGRQWQVTRMT